MELMGKYNLLRDSEYCPFTEFYQAYRLLLFALEKGGCFLLIHDERNPTFLVQQGELTRGRYKRFKGLLPEEIAGNKVFILGIQRIVEQLESYKKYSWLTEFKGKYLETT
jgi:hypothetical protein